MGQLVLDLVPLLFGILLSPLALMALIAVLVSARARTNGIAFALGWLAGIALVLTICFLLFGALQVRSVRHPPLWVPIVQLLVSAVLISGAVAVYRRGKARIEQMAAARSPRQVAAAAPQLPGWLQQVESFRPIRTFLLGLGLFVLNPVDASCAIIAALDARQAAVDDTTAAVTLIVFGLVASLSIVAPVVIVVVRGRAAEPFLARIRTWVAGNTHVLNAALLLVIGVLQLQKSLSGLIG
ncbi:GAP family protein [Leifsonia sp. TF02-11]|uniref:GAP family protein n=1 Tax=Leifsonia sp. TF02-11 TaxID=2815212 RepID=UPI001AA1C0E4|nr:GAP family protein [Leifsonia sp. TF02-11]MBO1738000.1 GAP family protein [Leifsonia sp. TF02-11]